ncbi:Toprim domain-containing protein [Xylophilus ampelinus]|uniref:Toprim domain-containing protein n=2 Tax=Xylophilus ampelinus TaxID=54067 RepID=A0A318SE39_9BURK|nr:Toprim domain-containing protein [Xylophilus ampelinus]
MPRDEWARIGMAIKSEFPEDDGLALFMDWSRTADGHQEAATRSTWRSIKAGGGVAIGTLLRVAKQNGFEVPSSSTNAGSSATQRQPKPRTQNRDADQARQAAAQDSAAVSAHVLWESGDTDSSSPYLERKGVRAHGVRCTDDGWLLIPLRDAGGRLWNVQRIAPAKPAKGPEKLFQRGGRKSGLWHLLGTAPAQDSGSPVLVAEGYATAASIHEATGHPVAVAFDAGNLIHVTRALRSLYPMAQIVVCGDDDRATQAKSGTNPGRAKAEGAAQAVAGVPAFVSAQTTTALRAAEGRCTQCGLL